MPAEQPLAREQLLALVLRPQALLDLGPQPLVAQQQLRGALRNP